MNPYRELPDELLSAYLDGEATHEERRQVEQRLAEDPEYGRQLDELRQLQARLASLPQERLDPQFWQRVLSQIQSALPVGGTARTLSSLRRIPATMWSPERGFRRGLAWAAIATAAAILLVIFVPERPPTDRVARAPDAARRLARQPSPPADATIQALQPTDEESEGLGRAEDETSDRRGIEHHAYPRRLDESAGAFAASGEAIQPEPPAASAPEPKTDKGVANGQHLFHGRSRQESAAKRRQQLGRAADAFQRDQPAGATFGFESGATPLQQSPHDAGADQEGLRVDSKPAESLSEDDPDVWNAAKDGRADYVVYLHAQPATDQLEKLQFRMSDLRADAKPAPKTLPESLSQRNVDVRSLGAAEISQLARQTIDEGRSSTARQLYLVTAQTRQLTTLLDELQTDSAASIQAFYRVSVAAAAPESEAGRRLNEPAVENTGRATATPEGESDSAARDQTPTAPASAPEPDASRPTLTPHAVPSQYHDLGQRGGGIGAAGTENRIRWKFDVSRYFRNTPDDQSVRALIVLSTDGAEQAASPDNR